MRLLKIIVMIGLTAAALFVAAVGVLAVADAIERRKRK
jgi:hypothetical protein